MSNRFPYKAESLALSRVDKSFSFFFLSFFSNCFCLGFISPGERAHGEIRDFLAVSRVLHLTCFQQAG